MSGYQIPSGPNPCDDRNPNDFNATCFLDLVAILRAANTVEMSACGTMLALCSMDERKDAAMIPQEMATIELAKAEAEIAKWDARVKQQRNRVCGFPFIVPSTST
ncbi:hypothetical protein [Caballeronia sp. RCC_10]|uniref:hypothetical protein n=1 Tax=Caballeronia sp. RCC_10 TaxID=3239227 RepID=UPI00352431F1